MKPVVLSRELGRQDAFRGLRTLSLSLCSERVDMCGGPASVLRPISWSDAGAEALVHSQKDRFKEIELLAYLGSIVMVRSEMSPCPRRPGDRHVCVEHREIQSATSIRAEQAIRHVPDVLVPTEVLLRWMATVAPLPAHVAGHAWVGMNRALESAIHSAAAEAVRREADR